MTQTSTHQPSRSQEWLLSKRLAWSLTQAAVCYTALTLWDTQQQLRDSLIGQHCFASKLAVIYCEVVVYTLWQGLVLTVTVPTYHVCHHYMPWGIWSLIPDSGSVMIGTHIDIDTFIEHILKWLFQSVLCSFHLRPATKVAQTFMGNECRKGIKCATAFAF